MKGISCGCGYARFETRFNGIYQRGDNTTSSAIRLRGQFSCHLELSMQNRDWRKTWLQRSESELSEMEKNWHQGTRPFTCLCLCDSVPAVWLACRSLVRSAVPTTKHSTPFVPAMASTFSTPRGVSIIHHIGKAEADGEHDWTISSVCSTCCTQRVQMHAWVYLIRANDMTMLCPCCVQMA